VQNRISIKQLFILLFATILATSCKYGSAGGPSKPSFSDYVGIKYIEVRREFSNGYSFNWYGFQQEPEWILRFMSEDSVMVYSPFEKKFLHYPIYFDHDSVFNVAREWIRLKAINKDSLVFQLLMVENKEISKDKSNVFMRFFSEDYIKRNRINPKLLQRPRPHDTLYVKSLIAKANRNPNHPDSCFAARNPVQLISTNPGVKVKQSHGIADIMNPSKAEEYLNPNYKIIINGAYKDFTHNFTVVVDEKGKMHLGKFLVDDEFRESRTRVLNGIIEVYLQKYLKIIPGHTLGMPHSSEIMLYLRGYKAP